MKTRANYGIIGASLNSVTPGGVYTEEDLRLGELAGTWPNVASVATPTVVSFVYPNSALAASTAGGETITVNGYNFLNTSTITVNGVSVTTTFVSFNQLTFVSNVMQGDGIYNLVVTNPSTSLSSTAKIPFSTPPIFYTSAGTLGTFTPGAPVYIPINVYTSPVETVLTTLNSGSLPSGLVLDTYNSIISGTAPVITTTTNYSFVLILTNSNNQSSTRSFSISIVGTQIAASVTGGSLTTIGSNNFVTFGSSDTLTVTQLTINTTFNYILVGGGGGGGSGSSTASNLKAMSGGGGGGGVVVKNNQSLSLGSYGITIGGGGGFDSSGGDTTFNGYTALGGGYGGNGSTPSVGGNGGSGGGGGAQTYNSVPTYKAAGSATQPSSASGGYGNAGGVGSNMNSGATGQAGGGGGAGSAASGYSPGSGYTWNDGNVYGAGGAGGHFDIVSSATTGYGAGGAGAYLYNNIAQGGGGSGYNAFPAKTGNSGAVVIQFPTTTAQPIPTTSTIVWINPLNNASFTSYQNFTITSIQLNAYTYYGDTQTYSANGLPTGVTCSSAGLVSGKPTTVGTYTTTFTVTSSYNSVAKSITVTFNILAEFNAWITPLSGSTIGSGTYRQGYAISSYTLLASGALPGDNTFTYSSSNLPAGLSISGNQIVGTPTTYGNISVTVTATSAVTSGTTSVTFTMSILSPYTSATGGSITTVGNYTVHTFASSDTFNVSYSDGSAVEYLVIAGGGSGGISYSGFQGQGGGGGAGGVSAGTTTVTAQSYTITVGGGGAARSGNNGQKGAPGTSSSALGISTNPGGGGGSTGASGGAAPTGTWGSGGGGGCYPGGAGAAGTGGQGYAGANGSGNNIGGGGGGAGGTGFNTNGTGYGPSDGGIGITSSITGTSVNYAGGGGGAANAGSNSGGNYYAGAPAGYRHGGLYGGGIGYSSIGSPWNAGATSGGDNTGAGGGAGGGTSGGGGSGIVILKYRSS